MSVCRRGDSMSAPFVIGLTGPLCAGKQVIIDLIRAQHPAIGVYSLSDAIRHELRTANEEITRESLINKGNELRAAYGPGALARSLVPLLDPSQSYIVDSIRHPSEAEALRTMVPHFACLVAVDAPLLTRFRRVVARSREKDPTDLESFVAKDDMEMYGMLGTNAQAIRECMFLADIMVVNRESSIEKLKDVVNIHQWILAKGSRTIFWA
eukprot:ANDGO_02377.mRNA.1 UPF0200 protein MJ1399